MSFSFDNTNSKKKNLNPIIENLLKDPINFKIAKNPDKVSIKPSSYIVFKSFKNGKDNKSKENNKISESDSNPNSNPKNKIMTRPKSMAEAVANYAGKKYSSSNSSSSSLPKKRKPLSDIDQKEKMKRLLLQQSNNNDNNNSSSTNNKIDTDDTDNIEDDNKSAETKNDANINKDENDDDDDDDDDFHTAESEDDSNDEDNKSNFNSDSDNSIESAIDDEDEDEDDNIRLDQLSDNDAEEVDENELKKRIPSEEIDPLKKDLKEDKLSKQILKNETTETPPTSNNDDDEYIQKNQLIDNNFSMQEFWDLNELENNHGSNNSDRIVKSWGDFIENHTSLGLLNHGVTCYMNAAVQSLCHIPSLTHYLIDVYHGKYDDTIKSDSVTKVLASTIAKMYRIGHNKKIIYINPKKLCKRLEDINCMMSEWQQEDSHEYFMSLMSRLQEDSTPRGVKLNKSIIYDIFGGLLDQTVTCKNCGHISTTEQEFYDLSLGLDNRKKRSSLMVEPQQLNQLKEQIEKCDSSTDNSKNQLSKILQQRILLAQEEFNNGRGNSQSTDNVDDENINTQQDQNHGNNENQTQNQSQSKNQSLNSQNQDIVQQQQSQIQNDSSNQSQLSDQNTPTKRYSLENSIRDFFTPEILRTDKRDQSGYVCEQCKVKTNAIKISTIQRSPETLSIHLKRFRFNGQQSQKVKANVSYPEILDLTSYTTKMSTPTRYKLTSVIIHQGRSVSSGHYIAHCRQPDGTWATYDDEYINKIPRASALSDPGAYVLIYERLTYKDQVNNDIQNSNSKKRKRNTDVTADSSVVHSKSKKRK